MKKNLEIQKISRRKVGHVMVMIDDPAGHLGSGQSGKSSTMQDADT